MTRSQWALDTLKDLDFPLSKMGGKERLFFSKDGSGSCVANRLKGGRWKQGNELGSYYCNQVNDDGCLDQGESRGV